MFPTIFPDAKSSFQEPHRDAAPFDPALGQSELPPVVSSDTHFSMFHLNPQGFNSEAKRTLFDTLLQHLQKPAIAGVAAAWLTKTTDMVTFTRYERVSKLDRRFGRPDPDSIALVARDDFLRNIVHI